jgi:hypothetical protein
MTAPAMLDSAGRRRSPAMLPGFHAGRAPRNKGMLYPADPPTVEEIVCVMRHASEDPHGWRLRAMIVMLWRGGLRVQEALALSERDLDPRRGSVLVRHGKGGRRREVGMDAWGWESLRPWLSERLELPAGPLFCVIDGPHPRAALVSCRSRLLRAPCPGHVCRRRRTARRAWRRARTVAMSASRPCLGVLANEVEQPVDQHMRARAHAEGPVASEPATGVLVGGRRPHQTRQQRPAIAERTHRQRVNGLGVTRLSVVREVAGLHGGELDDRAPELAD